MLPIKLGQIIIAKADTNETGKKAIVLDGPHKGKEVTIKSKDENGNYFCEVALRNFQVFDEKSLKK